MSEVLVFDEKSTTLWEYSTLCAMIKLQGMYYKACTGGPGGGGTVDACDRGLFRKPLRR